MAHPPVPPCASSLVRRGKRPSGWVLTLQSRLLGPNMISPMAWLPHRRYALQALNTEQRERRKILCGYHHALCLDADRLLIFPPHHSTELQLLCSTYIHEYIENDYIVFVLLVLKGIRNIGLELVQNIIFVSYVSGVKHSRHQTHVTRRDPVVRNKNTRAYKVTPGYDSPSVRRTLLTKLQTEHNICKNSTHPPVPTYPDREKKENRQKK